MSLRSKRNPGQRPFFVYGTLLPGQPNSHLWQGEIDASHSARFVGARLHDMGNYPMLVESDVGVVYGRLVYLKPRRYQQILELVDVLEGFDEAAPDDSAYRRVMREIELDEGRQVAAWIYIGQAEYVPEGTLIKHGNWLRHIEGRLDQIQKWWQQVDTVSGMHELK